MGILLLLIGFVAIVALIDLAALRFGVDTRPFSTDRRAPRHELTLR